MNSDFLGTILQTGNLQRINNGLVEDASCTNNANASILVSYSASGQNNAPSRQRIRLNLTRNTVVLNSFGQNMGLCALRPGMRINAVYSGSTTRSIPPQANAFLIMVRRDSAPPSETTTGRIVMVDFDNGFLYATNPNNLGDLTRYVVTGETAIVNRSGAPLRLGALRPGQLVRITHANFKTSSIPPQTTAYRIQLL